MDTSSVDRYQMIKTLLLAMAIFLSIYRLWTCRHLYRFALKFPRHIGLPFIGFLSKVSSLKDIIPGIAKMFSQCKSYTICIWIGMYPAVVTADPHIVEKILSSPELLNKARPMYNSIENFLQGGVLCSRVEKWRKNRKLINPAFNHQVLLSFMPIFNKAKNVAQKKLDGLVGRGEHKVAQMFFRITLGIGVESIMGKMMNEEDPVEEIMTTKFDFIMKSTTIQILLSFIKMNGIFRLYKRLNDVKIYFYNFVSELIQQRLDATKSVLFKDDDNDESVLSLKNTPNIFIDQVFKMYQKNQFTWQDIISESNTMMVASIETTGNTLFFILIMLAMHPEVQEKLYEELLEVFPEKDFEFEYEHIAMLPYLDRVIKETLRLCPSIPIMGRHVERDTQLTKDILLPKGLQLLISIFHLHRRQEIWGPDADKFDPDHFLPENLADKHSHAFIPFSKGSRNCIGWRYAMISMKAIISGVVRNFRFSTSFKYDDLELLESISLKCHKEPGLEVHRR